MRGLVGSMLAVVLLGCGGSTQSDPKGTGGQDAGVGGFGGTSSGGTSSGGTSSGGTSSGGTSSGGSAGSISTGGAAGTSGDCAGLSYCDCDSSNLDCQVLSEACFCPCGIEPCKPDCDCACGGGKYLGCAPKSIIQPGAFEGLWLIGWSGGMNHFSWVLALPGGKALFNDGASLTANGPLWSCNGEGSWSMTQKPETIFLYLPPSCPGMPLTFQSFQGKPDYPKGCVLSATLEPQSPSGMPLMACKFPSSQCDATLTSCVDPLI